MLKESQLLFIICQPRSGSSMLQQLLLQNNKINGVPETWLLLPLIHTYKDSNIQEGFNLKYSAINWQRVLDQYKAESLYHDHLKELILKSYTLVNNDSSAKYFLDKTPRYYHIIHEIEQLLPKAKIIVLKRNPLSVFSSILKYNFKGDYKRFIGSKDRLEDIFTAIEVLSKIEKSKNVHVLRYEDILEDTEKEMAAIYQFLDIDIPSTEALGEYNVGEEFSNTPSMDLKSVKKHNKPVKEYLDAWKSGISDNQIKTISEDYLMKLGKPTFEKFGYHFDLTIDKLRKHKVKIVTRLPVSFNLVQKNFNELTFRERWYLRLKILTGQ